MILSHHITSSFSLGNPKPEGPDQEATHHRTAHADAMHNKILPFLLVPSVSFFFLVYFKKEKKRRKPAFLFSKIPDLFFSHWPNHRKNIEDFKRT
ncbi:hypothetical protein BDV37DRAFT_262478 [Aspergillus pseudonomiae]|uniref:Uncharacterized protein n=1 Tax=Aspergillus pseudonomiae TaxID=1506151 RepID=A0A5N7CXB9_9EURO|nr:uncharacterized protein BDV37DRAFT_262478 [Aspergillus pseudonomiae]KAE8398811.1 hypothetical protein BDV37DRAFT_262478 [Aspergillus pseudonomiae]